MSLFRRPTEDTAPPEEASVAGERGIASVNRARSLQSRVSSVLAIGLMSALGVGLLTWYYANTFSRRARVQQSAQAATKSRAQGEMPLPSLGPISMPRVLGPPPAPPADLATAPSAANPSATGAPPYGGSPDAAYAAPGAGAPPEKSPAQRSIERRLSGPAFAQRGQESESGAVESEEGAGRNAALVAVGEEGRAAQAPPMARTASSDSALTGLLRPTVTPAVRAQVLPTERLLLPKGAFIDCTLETAIDSTLPGMTTCVTATDTFSVDGQVVLLERGTKLVGETRGEVQQGSARVFVLWTEARTPTGVVVPLASPGTDELGRAGLAGQVDRHFWQRFGAAILISVIDGALQAAVQSSSNNGTVIVNPSASQDVMTEVLKSTVNIPPTVTKQNGDRIQVFVARDLDFRSVYELRPVVASH
jgi:type IV secretion system protein VirB10